MKFQDMARGIIDANRYMVLGTLDPDGRPRVSPVFYAPDGYSTFYWISGQDTHHSRNLADRAEVSLVIFDSTAPVGQGAAVYLIATAAQVPDAEFDQVVEPATRPRFPEQRRFPREELQGAAPFRLYRARVSEHSVHVRGGDPEYGTGVDSRRVVELG